MRVFWSTILTLLFAALWLPLAVADDSAGAASPAQRNAYFGDLHIHTRYSYDAYIFNVRRDPDDAYRYARGEPLMHADGFPVRMHGAPLDFLAVTEHAEYLGVLNAMGDPNHPLSKSELARELIKSDPTGMRLAMGVMSKDTRQGKRVDLLYREDIMRETWQKVIDAAERHYRPGEFTTLVGYEYTATPGGANMHRNVIFRSAKVPPLPFTLLDSQNPEDLWRWLDEQRELGIESLAIPHNSNHSFGKMFAREQTNGDPFDAAYAALRARNEPLAEITQVKGTSETHPSLSPNDEWADFEIWDTPDSQSGNYVRDALLAGLEMEAGQGFNPFRFGLIGSSDNHSAASSYDEATHFGKLSVFDGSAEVRGSIPPDGSKTWPVADALEDTGFEKQWGVAFTQWGASGLTGVWAEENTREAIYDALRRKETFATSGPRISVRFFAGYDYPDELLQSKDLVKTAYADGVTMGADLLARSGESPRFLVWALRDPRGSWLDRIQIVKGWVEDGESRERVFDVACSDGAVPNPVTQRCPDNGATVNLADCSYSFDRGGAELSALWTDPGFDAGQHALYYTRVLENPTCRWSTWDALRNGSPPRPDLASTIQERAWSSPIWYVPN